MTTKLHDLIYRLEEGGGKLVLRYVAGCLALLLFLFCYNWFCFHNMETQEAMDSAQLARNIAEGKGFTTLFIRPSSLRLLQGRAARNPALPTPWERADPARLAGMHPDIANPPFYPMVLAGLMRVLPFRYPVDLTHRFWSSPGIHPPGDSEEWATSRRFRRYQPDFIISAFNQALFLALAALTFFIARRLFNVRTAMLSTGLLLGTDLLWRFAVAGLSTILLMLIFNAVVWCLMLLEGEAARSEAGVQLSKQSSLNTGQAGNSQPLGLSVFVWAAVAGGLVGLGALTRYSFGWLILPLLLFIVLFTGRQRLTLSLAAATAFSVTLGPWIIRNWLVSGMPFGTATYTILEASALFPGDSLSRWLKPDLAVPGVVFVRLAWSKLLANGGQIVQSDLPSLGGTWVGGFFIIGLLVPLAERQTRRLGCFLAISVVLLAIVQALGQTQRSMDSPMINSENLLVLVVPGVWIYGAGFFYRLLEEFHWSVPSVWSAVVACFAGLTCLPLILGLLAARRSPVAFPPYFPPSLQEAARFVKTDELMMSDIPWAAAWYGQVQCIWLTQTKGEFLAVNDRLKPIRALYLSHASGGGAYQSLAEWLQAGREGWGAFMLGCVLNKQQGKPGPPADFPLEYWQKGWPAHFLLTSREKPLTEPGLK
ncbi:MAG TPA: hypothetical protein VFE51_04175 [Verrucomicrobiae bacterium]|nr:hypothetical protein [Verrucomicrobiae bacterium]